MTSVVFPEGTQRFTHIAILHLTQYTQDQSRIVLYQNLACTFVRENGSPTCSFFLGPLLKFNDIASYSHTRPSQLLTNASPLLSHY